MYSIGVTNFFFLLPIRHQIGRIFPSFSLRTHQSSNLFVEGRSLKKKIHFFLVQFQKNVMLFNEKNGSKLFSVKQNKKNQENRQMRFFIFSNIKSRRNKILLKNSQTNHVLSKFVGIPLNIVYLIDVIFLLLLTHWLVQKTKICELKSIYEIWHAFAKKEKKMNSLAKNQNNSKMLLIRLCSGCFSPNKLQYREKIANWLNSDNGLF